MDEMRITVVQRRPNTCITVECGEKTGIGFSKVSWPDTWSQKLGFHLALGKAMAEVLGIGGPRSGDGVLHFTVEISEPFHVDTPPISLEDVAKLWDRNHPVSPRPSESICCPQPKPSVSPSTPTTGTPYPGVVNIECEASRDSRSVEEEAESNYLAGLLPPNVTSTLGKLFDE